MKRICAASTPTPEEPGKKSPEVPFPEPTPPENPPSPTPPDAPAPPAVPPIVFNYF